MVHAAEVGEGSDADIVSFRPVLELSHTPLLLCFRHGCGLWHQRLRWNVSSSLTRTHQREIAVGNVDSATSSAAVRRSLSSASDVESGPRRGGAAPTAEHRDGAESGLLPSPIALADEPEDVIAERAKAAAAWQGLLLSRATQGPSSPQPISTADCGMRTSSGRRLLLNVAAPVRALARRVAVTTSSGRRLWLSFKGPALAACPSTAASSEGAALPLSYEAQSPPSATAMAPVLNVVGSMDDGATTSDAKTVSGSEAMSHWSTVGIKALAEASPPDGVECGAAAAAGLDSTALPPPALLLLNLRKVYASKVWFQRPHTCRMSKVHLPPAGRPRSPQGGSR